MKFVRTLAAVAAALLLALPATAGMTTCKLHYTLKG